MQEINRQHAVFGKPFEQTLDTAKQLLTTTSLSINELCKECGIMMSVSEFIRAFKRYYGVTPAQYRRSLREKE